mmetsp:Transcript_81187/g.225984  ORF Transcript_81187/g.225984 Transcript_81187/m.225984 type:complete len:462 (-) Transcript_81187:223-1608(-)
MVVRPRESTYRGEAWATPQSTQDEVRFRSPYTPGALLMSPGGRSSTPSNPRYQPSAPDSGQQQQQAAMRNSFPRRSTRSESPGSIKKALGMGRSAAKAPSDQSRSASSADLCPAFAESPGFALLGGTSGRRLSSTTKMPASVEAETPAQPAQGAIEEQIGSAVAQGAAQGRSSIGRRLGSRLRSGSATLCGLAKAAASAAGTPNQKGPLEDAKSPPGRMQAWQTSPSSSPLLSHADSPKTSEESTFSRMATHPLEFLQGRIGGVNSIRKASQGSTAQQSASSSTKPAASGDQDGGRRVRISESAPDIIHSPGASRPGRHGTPTSPAASHSTSSPMSPPRQTRARRNGRWHRTLELVADPRLGTVAQEIFQSHGARGDGRLEFDRLCDVLRALHAEFDMLGSTRDCQDELSRTLATKRDESLSVCELVEFLRERLRRLCCDRTLTAAEFFTVFRGVSVSQVM